MTELLKPSGSANASPAVLIPRPGPRPENDPYVVRSPAGAERICCAALLLVASSRDPTVKAAVVAVIRPASPCVFLSHLPR